MQSRTYQGAKDFFVVLSTSSILIDLIPCTNSPTHTHTIFKKQIYHGARGGRDARGLAYLKVEMLKRWKIRWISD